MTVVRRTGEQHTTKGMETTARAWWFVVNPTIQGTRRWLHRYWLKKRVGSTYSKQMVPSQANMRRARRGDILVWYSARTDKQIRGIGKIVRGGYVPQSGEPYVHIDVKLLSCFRNGIPLDEMRRSRILRNSQPLWWNSSGTLFKLTEREYREIQRIAVRMNPELVDSFPDSALEPTREKAGEPIIMRPSVVSKRAIDRAKRRLRFGGSEPIEIEKEISKLTLLGPTELPRALKEKPVIRAGSDTVDISAGINLVENRVHIGAYPLHIQRGLSASAVERLRGVAIELHALVSKIEQMFGIDGGFASLCVDYTPNRDAFRYERRILCNVVQYEKRRSFSFWLVTLAREFAYLLHPTRDMRHMSLMRELLVRALDHMQLGR